MKARPSRILSAFGCAATLAGAVSAHAAQGVCGAWSHDFGTPNVFPAPTEMLAFDDGSGPALYLAGVAGAGNVRAYGLARWDGTQAAPVGEGVRGDVHALCAFNAGNGLELYAGGKFEFASGVAASNVARWDGTTWHPLGAGVHGEVFELFVHDDGTGPALYAGGTFDNAGGLAASNVARWDGVAWTALGEGVSGGVGPSVRAMATFVGPLGTTVLYVGGRFATAGIGAANNVAFWDGAGWSPLDSGGNGTNGIVRALAVWDPPGVPPLALYVGGAFSQAGSFSSEGIARWRGSTWTQVPGLWVFGSDSGVHALQPFDDGTGPALFVAGEYSGFSDNLSNVAKWLGSSWSAATLSGDGVVISLGVFDDGSGERLYAGANFDTVSSTFLHVRTPTSWEPALVDASARGANRPVEALAVYESDDGPRLVAGGSFTKLGAADIPGVGVWNGSAWSALGGGIEGTVLDFAHFREPSASCDPLFAAGSFAMAGGTSASNVARFDGAQWSDVGGGTDGVVRALAVYDAPGALPPKLYAGGEFDHVAGNAFHNIAQWDGTAWTNAGAIGDPFGVFALCVYDGGDGPELYAGGNFIDVGSNGEVLPIRSIARWNGVRWAELGAGLDSSVAATMYPYVYALCVYDDGNGPSLIVGGGFASVDGVPMRNVARWDGRAWSSLGVGIPATVASLAVLDDGSGPALYAGIAESGLGSAYVDGDYLLRWTGSAWVDAGPITSDYAHPLFPGDYPSRITSMLALDEDDGVPSLWFGGRFTVAGDAAALGIARVKTCASAPGIAYCFGDGSLGVPCPCAPPDTVPNPSGAAGHGCANSFDLDGAVLSARGSAEADDVELVGRELTPVGFTFFFAGTAEIASGVAVSDGVRCAGGSLTRFGSQFAACGRVRYPNADAGWTLPLSVVSGTMPGSGVTKHYQAYYRNAAAGFCNPSTANLTNAYRIVW